MSKIMSKNVKKYILYSAIIVFIIIIVKKTYETQRENQFYIYKDNFLSPEDFTALLNDLTKYNQALNSSEQKAKNVFRYNLVLDKNVVQPPTHPVTTLLHKYQESIRTLTQQSSLYLAKNFPIEYRKYVNGSFMKKHKDTLIYNIPQYECVLTLSNTTDSVTIMGGNKSIKARPNSLIIVRAQGIEHEVTKVTTGERTFLKFIFTATDKRAKASGV